MSRSWNNIISFADLCLEVFIVRDIQLFLIIELSVMFSIKAESNFLRKLYASAQSL